MTYRLHYAPDNASLIVRIALEHLGVGYEPVLVDRRVKAQRSEGYLALNPAGRIPVMETPEGPVFETGACLMWLADRHGGMLPGNRAESLRWLFYVATTAHPPLIQMFYTHRWVSSGSMSELRQGVAKDVNRALSVLDAAVEGPFLHGPEPSVTDIYICALLRWSQIYPTNHPGWCDLTSFASLRALAKAVDALPATQRVAEAEGLGAQPFSDPHLPNPPEGSAL